MQTNTLCDDDWQSGKAATLPNVKGLLESRSQNDHIMTNFVLSNADLSNINLTKPASAPGYDFVDGDFYRADFSHAHCFKLDLSGSSLMKANFSDANLHCADLTNCNLLGTRFNNAKLENVVWGEIILHEQLALDCQDFKQKQAYYSEAEEIYRHLRLVTEKQGLFEVAGHFFQREMIMRRKRKPLFSLERWGSKLVDILCGYGEKPMRVMLFTTMVIMIFSIIYFFTGVYSNGQNIQFNSNASLAQNLQSISNCVYYSVITFTTLGYGDIVPIGMSRFWAAMEALIGSFTLAVFVVVFVKKMTR